MGLGKDAINLVSASRDKLSEVGKEIGDILNDEESTLIEKKEELEEKIEELPVSGREWRKFSKSLDKEAPNKTDKLVKKFNWDSQTAFEVAKIYANMTYYEAEITLSESQQLIYDSAETMRELEEYIQEGDIEKGKVVKMYNRAKNDLEKALSNVKEAEKGLDRSRICTEHFGISGNLAEKLEEKEKLTDETREEIKRVSSHVAEMREKIT